MSTATLTSRCWKRWRRSHSTCRSPSLHDWPGSSGGEGHGIDDAPHGIYAGKVEQERLVEVGEVPWTILRATQFHEFAGQIFTRMKLGPISIVRTMQSQPIAAREVATHLIELAEANPAGRVDDLAGPRVERMADLSRRWAAATVARSSVLEVPILGGMGRAMRDGSLLARAGVQLGMQTFDQWIAEV